MGRKTLPLSAKKAGHREREEGGLGKTAVWGICTFTHRGRGTRPQPPCSGGGPRCTLGEGGENAFKLAGARPERGRLLGRAPILASAGGICTVICLAGTALCMRRQRERSGPKRCSPASIRTSSLYKHQVMILPQVHLRNGYGSPLVSYRARLYLKQSKGSTHFHLVCERSPYPQR